MTTYSHCAIVQDKMRKGETMKIKIVGNPKSLTKKECKKTAKFFLGLLLTKEEITNKKLCIHFGKKFAFSESSAVEGEGYAYECIDGSYAIWISSKLDRDSKIEILANKWFT